jgi:Ran GTPase-activating protein (RanGAP) involved in mRNA processing and transport
MLKYQAIVGRRFNTALEVDEICTEINKISKTLQEVTISGNSFGVQACIALAQSLANCHNLQIVK